MFRVLAVLLCSSVAGLSLAAQQEIISADAHFRERVLPVLRDKCFECHGPDLARPKGGFSMRDRASVLLGGGRGPAVVPGDPEASRMLQAVRASDGDLAMPPDEALEAQQIDWIATWIKDGAVWPLEAAPAPIEPSAEDTRFFEEQIRPLLATNCFECHGPDLATVMSGLRMSSRAQLLLGGSRGPALVPGDPQASLIVKALEHSDPKLRMPPTGKLPEAERAQIQEWIQRGAPWPTYGASAEETHELPPSLDPVAARDEWAYRPVVRPEVPRVKHQGLVANPIDAFVFARLEAAGLEPGLPAPARELARRAYAVLVGLPPSFADLQAFEEDRDEGALTRLTQTLLARSDYGEHWARHWLDVVRFAQTNGYERDAEKPLAWRYRDYVIDALNADKPYDQFLAEQLAGDELRPESAQARIATGFYRLGAWDDEPDDAAQAEYDAMDDVLRTIGEGLLGTTLGCARCHDHKFDPIPQSDYYSMLAFLRSVRPYEAPRYAPDSSNLRPLDDSTSFAAKWESERRTKLKDLEQQRQGEFVAGERELRAQRLAELPPEARAAWSALPGARDARQRQLVRETEAQVVPDRREVRSYLAQRTTGAGRELFLQMQQMETSFEGDFDWVLCVTESGSLPVPTHLLQRGQTATPGALVAPAFPRVMVREDADARPPASLPIEGQSTGLRSQLAAWIASPLNPLTARVIVNRVWQYHFGCGIVATPNDFGHQGAPPTHPELLDWLAADFVEHGWSLKHLHALIIDSYVWRMSSRAVDEQAQLIDPANTLLWRQNPRRLEAEALRDAALQVAGVLDREAGGRGFFISLPREALSGSSQPGHGWGWSDAQEQARRSIYSFVKRGLQSPLYSELDAPNASLPVGKRSVSTLATQALLLINGEFMDEQAMNLAARVAASGAQSPSELVEQAVRLALARSPSEEERALLGDYYNAQVSAFAARPTAPLVFQQRAPTRVAKDYLACVPGRAVLDGPREGWSFLKGSWGDEYNDTLEPDALSGPIALFDQHIEGFSCALQATLRLERGCELASLVLGVQAQADLWTGVELAVLPGKGIAELRAPDASGAPILLASALFEGDPARSLLLELRNEHGHLRASLDGQVWMEADWPASAGAGQIGIRTAGEALVVESLRIEVDDSALDLAPLPQPPAEQRALAALCQLLLNSNEFAYVD